MIDVGTGSGVLSIAAKYLGAGEIDAYDIDDEAIKATKENVALNPVAQDINIGTNSLLDGISKSRFDRGQHFSGNHCPVDSASQRMLKSRWKIHYFRNHQ